jgi:hypothetical protein
MKKMKNLMKPITLLLMVFISSAIFFGSCKKDSTTTPADQTALTKVMVSADSLSTAAIPANYPQTAIDAYKTTLQTIKTAATSTTLTQAQVDNLVVQLNAAMTLFKTKAYSYIDESLYLVAGWHFDEGTGTTATSYSTAKQVGTFTKGWTTLLGSAAVLPTWVTGAKGGKAIYLTKGAHLEVPYTASLLPANITISAWIKMDKIWENDIIVSQNYWWGYKFQTQGGGKPMITERISATSVQDFDDGDATVTTGAWSHVVVSLNSTTKVLKFYINGVLTHTYTALDNVGALTQTLNFVDGTTTYTPQPFLIGALATDAEIAAKPDNFSWITTANVGCFEGAIDELKIYNTALSDGQVGKLYNDEKP